MLKVARITLYITFLCPKNRAQSFFSLTRNPPAPTTKSMRNSIMLSTARNLTDQPTSSKKFNLNFCNKNIQLMIDQASSRSVSLKTSWISRAVIKAMNTHWLSVWSYLDQLRQEKQLFKDKQKLLREKQRSLKEDLTILNQTLLEMKGKIFMATRLNQLSVPTNQQNMNILLIKFTPGSRLMTHKRQKNTCSKN